MVIQYVQIFYFTRKFSWVISSTDGKPDHVRVSMPVQCNKVRISISFKKKIGRFMLYLDEDYE